MPEERWPSYWLSDLSDEKRRLLEAELHRELPAGHVLHGHSVIAKARGKHPDDVVFQLPDGRLAAVHLTWNVESDAQFPFTLIFPDLKALGASDEWG